MNSTQAKQIPLERLLATLGHEPVKRVKGMIWYHSPFREEAEPSFKITEQLNTWYDFGEGQGGTVVDFALRYYQTSSIREALARLDALDMHGSSRSTAPRPLRPAPLLDLLEPEAPPVAATAPEPAPATHSPASDGMTITKVQPLQNPALLSYLQQRGIRPDVARPLVQEMYYGRGGKNYFALAFPNRSGGYELRNPYYKGGTEPKDITIIEGEGPELAVFEGFLDYISAVQLGELDSNAPALVMNSIAMQEKALAFIRTHDATVVNLYLDRDAQGRAMAAHIAQALPGLDVRDCSDRYAGYKDLNAVLEAARGKGR